MDNSSKTMEDIAPINNLNDHCLKHIFSFLPFEERLEIEKVCKRWRIIGEQGWNDIKTLKISQDDSDNMIYLLLKRCGRYLRHLKVHYTPEHPHSLSMAIKFCRLDQFEEIELINLDFRGTDVEQNDRNLREFFEKSGKLVAVTLKGVFHREILDYFDLLNPKTLRKLCLVNRIAKKLKINPDRFPNLKELCLGEVTIIENETMREEESLKGLEKMDIGYCNVPENFLERIRTFTNLQTLGFSLNTININRKHIRSIIRHCDKIKEMSVRDFYALTSECFQYLGEMQSLEVLNLLIYSSNTQDFVHLTNVKKLSLNSYDQGLKGDGLIKLIINSSNLEELEFVKIRSVDGLFLDNINEIFKLGQRTKHLIVRIKGQGYRHLIGLEEITYHPLLDLRVDNDADESDDDIVLVDDTDDDDYYSNDDDDDHDDIF